MAWTQSKMACSKSLLLLIVTFAGTWPSMAAVHPDVGLNVYELITKYGYSYELHSVTTQDGYILELQRVAPKASAGNARRPPILLMHGLLSSAADWVNIGNRSLAFTLADLGFDVWLGNARGTTASRRHVTLNPDQHPRAFFNFTWHHIGYYDIPAKIDYILDRTGARQLQYVGFSQGTTVFFTMASTRPEYNAKIKLMTALAPIAELKHFKNPILRLAAKWRGSLEFILRALNVHELMRYEESFEAIGTAFCDDGKPTQELCKMFLFAIAGYDREQLEGAFLPVITSNAPGGASLAQVLHYLQLIGSDGVMRQYDDGSAERLPKAYDLAKISAPVALYYSENDWLSSEVDVEHFAETIGNCVRRQRNPSAKFNHIDYQWAIDIVDLLFNDVVELIVKYR